MSTETGIRITIEEMLTDEMIREIGADHEDPCVCVTRICGHLRRLEEAAMCNADAAKMAASKTGSRLSPEHRRGARTSATHHFPKSLMKLSQWLRGPVPERDPVIRRLNWIAFAGVVALTLWPVVALIMEARK